MSPLTSRQIFVWSLPTLFLLSFLWYKRKKGALQSDPGGTSSDQLNSGDISVEDTADISREESLVVEVVEESIHTSLVTSDKSENTNISGSVSDKVSIRLESHLNPESGDLTACGGEIVVQRVPQPKISSFAESVSTELPCDLGSALVVDEIGEKTPTDDCGSVTAEEEKVEVCSPDGKIEDPVLEENKVLNQSWSEECELEVGAAQVEGVPVAGVTSIGEMARERSSNASLEGNAVEEDCVVRNLHVETTALESKLATLELGGSEEKTVTDSKVPAVNETNSVERDSANHSPAEVMLGSPSMSNYSDVQSEGSSDSGKGCSDVATPPSRTPASGSSVAGDPPVPSVYEFVLPQLLVGRLIGSHGSFVHQIKTKTHANIFIKRHPETAKLKICAIEGTQMDIESALDMIRQKFPLKRYPNVTLDHVNFLPPISTYPLLPDSFQLQLVEGVNNDVILSSLVSPAHFFLQQPTHPTYPALNRLNLCMNYCYSEPTAPALPSPIDTSVICVAPTMGGWYRAQVVASDPASETSDVRFIDYGGYLTIENALLRQIRSDFITLPFQASECYLANVKPKDGVWPFEAMTFVEELTQGQVIQAQIYGYAKDGVPAVYLFSIQGSQVIAINQELVLRGYAEWDEPTEEADSTVPSSEAFAPAVSEAYAPVATEA